MDASRFRGRAQRKPDVEDNDGPLMAPETENPRVDGNSFIATPSRSPAKVQAIDTPSRTSWRFKHIIDTGLVSVRGPVFDEALPFNVQWEVTRLLQNKRVKLEKVQNDWPQPRTMASLYALDPSFGRFRIKEFEFAAPKSYSLVSSY